MAWWQQWKCQENHHEAARTLCPAPRNHGAVAGRDRSAADIVGRSGAAEAGDQERRGKEAQAAAGRTFALADRQFPDSRQAQAAAGETSLAAEISGKVWLFTLGAKGATTAGGTRVAEIGPVPPINAPEYLLRINHAAGAPGAKTAVHAHPGSEAFYVLAGRLGQRTPNGVSYAEAGQSMNGHGADTAMEVFSAGTSNLDQLVMFVVDATRPFSSPAKFE
jgi:hypothetical protein